MPEGPEVYVLSKWLKSKLVGKRITSVQRLRPMRSVDRFISRLLGRWVTSVDTKGKFMWIIFGDLYLGCRLGMNGWWTDERDQYAVLGLTTRGTTVYYRDPRKLGELVVLNRDQLERRLDRLGPDVLDRGFTPSVFCDLLNRRHNAAIGSWLLDQSILSGIGNYLRAEILYRCRLDPRVKVRKLLPATVSRLYREIVGITKASVKNGSTHGRYRLEVYGQDSVRGNAVATFPLGTRTMWWVPSVQTKKC